MKKQRISWIDTAKFWGMFCIYLGHFGENAGAFYPFVFEFHVPLFFFLSGCVEAINPEYGVIENLKKRMKTILLPFVGFALLSIGVYVLKANLDFETVKMLFIQLLEGCIRNSFFAGSLWFLSCHFVVSILFAGIKKLKNKLIILICSLFFFLLTTDSKIGIVIPPKWVWNIDSAFKYMIYYALGYVSFDKVNKKLEEKNIIYILGGIISICFTIALFFGKNWILVLYALPVVDLIVPIIKTFILIYAVIIFSYTFSSFPVINSVGRESLFLCGNEYIVKLICQNFIGLFGLNLIADNPLKICIYVMLLFCLQHNYIIPIEKKISTKIKMLFFT